MSDRKTDFERLMDDMQGKHSKRLNALMITMDDEDFVIAYFKALEYKIPKLQRQEITGALAVNKIIVEHIAIPIEEIKGDDKKLKE